MATENVFIDTSAFKALADPRDEFHKKAQIIWKNLQQDKSKLVTSNYILDETYTVLRTKRNLTTAIQFRETMIDGLLDTIQIYRITVDDETGAWKWFTQKWSRLSFTDCVCFAQMKRLGLKRVFTFDTHFKKAGFKIESI